MMANTGDETQMLAGPGVGMGPGWAAWERGHCAELDR